MCTHSWRLYSHIIHASSFSLRLSHWWLSFLASVFSNTFHSSGNEGSVKQKFKVFHFFARNRTTRTTHTWQSKDSSEVAIFVRIASVQSNNPAAMHARAIMDTSTVFPSSPIPVPKLPRSKELLKYKPVPNQRMWNKTTLDLSQDNCYQLYRQMEEYCCMKV